MSVFLVLAFLFFVGSMTGWVLELLFRRFISSSNPERKWINPGFCTGPYIPLYGFGLCVMFLMASLERYQSVAGLFGNKLLLFSVAAIILTALEYVAGILCMKITNLRLWDYTNQWGNIQGIICPKFSLLWVALGAVYYFLIHPHILGSLEWLSDNLAFSFVIGLFFGVFIIDVVHSSQIVVRLRKFAEDNDVILRYEAIKAQIRSMQDASDQKPQFFRPFGNERSLNELLKEKCCDFERKTRRKRK